MTPPFEPYRIKAIEPIPFTTRKERQSLIKKADYNIFRLNAEDIMIDFLSDSGGSAMSNSQWAGIMKADETYAGSQSFRNFEKAIQQLMHFKHIFPTSQGRVAERLLFSTTKGENLIIPNNVHFNTTATHIKKIQGEPINLIIAEGLEPSSHHPFKGNMDCQKLSECLEAAADRIPFVFHTITCNGNGGQPVSMENIRAVKEICKSYNKPLFFDACRFAENAYFIKQREKNYQDQSIVSIVKEMFSYADGMTMSAKKDGLANMGGWLALNDDAWAQEIENELILTQGSRHHGGLTGRDLVAITQGLEEVLQEDYLRHRIESTAYLGNHLAKRSIPVMQPIGGHAVCIDAQAMLSHIDTQHYPAQVLCIALYIEGGIRSIGIQEKGFVRLAIPRRTYTKSHLDYTIDCLGKISQNKENLQGYTMNTPDSPEYVQYLYARFEPLAHALA